MHWLSVFVGVGSLTCGCVVSWQCRLVGVSCVRSGSWRVVCVILTCGVDQERRVCAGAFGQAKVRDAHKFRRSYPLNSVQENDFDRHN